MEAIITLLLSHSEEAIPFGEDEYGLFCFMFLERWSVILKKLFKRGKWLIFVAVSRKEDSFNAGSRCSRSGELHEESGSIVEDSISSYWINPVSIKCKF